MVSLAQVLKALLVALVIAGSAYGVSKLNLFGLEAASDRVADDVYQRITAADYGPARKGQRAISVVYLDETSLEAMRGFGWTRFPPSYDQQWMMLDDVLAAGGAPPAALFVDFVYLGQGGAGEGFPTFVSGLAGATRADVWSTKPACTADPLMKLACIVVAGGVPIVLAKPSPADLEMFTDVQRALDGVVVLAPAFVGEKAYPLATDYGFDPARAEKLGVHRFDVSPAFALYVAGCLQTPDGCGVPAFVELRRRATQALAGRSVAASSAGAPSAFSAPMDVVWGSRPDPAYLAMTRAVSGKAAPCRGGGSGWFERLGEQAAGLRGPGAGARQECPYTLSLGYDRLVAGHGLEIKDLERLLAGKLVMVGGQFRASNDWVASPVHGRVPGVQYHAMALDNLMEAGVEYRRSSAATLDSDLLKSLLIAALAFCGVLGVMARNSLLDDAVEAGMEPRLRATVYGPLYVLLFTASIAVVGAATWIGVSFAHRSPINWIGITACALGFLFYATRQTLPADIIGSIGHLRSVRLFLVFADRCRDALKFEEDRLVKRKPASPQASSPSSLASTEAVPEATAHAPSAASDARPAARGAGRRRRARPKPG